MTDDRKLVMTLTAGPAAFTRRMATQMGVGTPEAVRRALTVLHLVLSLADDEELLVRNKTTSQLERVRFEWTDIR